MNDDDDDDNDVDLDTVEFDFEAAEKRLRFIENGDNVSDKAELLDSNSLPPLVYNCNYDYIKHLKTGDTGRLFLLAHQLFSVTERNNSIWDTQMLKYYSFIVKEFVDINEDNFVFNLILIDDSDKYIEVRRVGGKSTLLRPFSVNTSTYRQMFSEMKVFPKDSKEHSLVLNKYESLKEQKDAANVENYIATINRNRKADYERLLNKYNQSLVLKEVDNIMKEVCDFAFDDNWEFTKNIPSSNFRPESRFINRLTIKFPEIVITNSSKKSHTIKDFYLSVFFDETMRICNTLWGRREVYSYEEREIGYGHSHMETAVTRWCKMCIGDDTPIRMLITDMSLENKFTKEAMYNLAFLIKSYIVWESKEGGPYVSIENLRKSNSATPTTNINELALNQFKRYLTNVISIPKIPILSIIKNNNLNYFACDKNKLEDYIISEKNFESHFYSDMICYKTGDNRYFQNSSDRTSGENTLERWNKEIQDYCKDSESRKIHFKGQAIVPKVVYSLSMTDTTVTCLNPTLLELGIKQFEEELNKYYLNNKKYELTKLNEET